MTIYNENEDCHTLDIVLSGSLVVYSLSNNGSSTTIFEFNSGSVIGANLLFRELKKLSATGIIEINNRTITIKKSAL